jgi:hypothetical protein
MVELQGIHEHDMTNYVATKEIHVCVSHEHVEIIVTNPFES